MTFDEQLRRSLETLADRLREDITQHSAQSAEALLAAVEAERSDAVAAAERQAWSTAEQEISARLTASLAAAEERAHQTGITEGLEQAQAELKAAEDRARQSGFAEGLEQARSELRAAEDRARQSGLAEGLEQARSELRAAEDRARQSGLAEGLDQARAEAAEAARQARAAGVEEGAAQARGELAAADLAASERLVHAMRTIDRGRSLSEILDTLVSCAGREAARVGILLVRDERLRGWRFLGFDAALESASGIDMPLESGGVLSEAVRSGAVVTSGGSSSMVAPPFAELPAGREMIAVPVAIDGQVVAVLYADQGADGDMGRPSWSRTLEVLARHAARSLESVTAFRAAQMFTSRGSAGPASRPSGDPATVLRT